VEHAPNFDEGREIEPWNDDGALFDRLFTKVFRFQSFGLTLLCDADSGYSWSDELTLGSFDVTEIFNFAFADLTEDDRRFESVGVLISRGHFSFSLLPT
jgi:hypothetical protein